MVKPEYRGQGYGMQLWQAALDTVLCDHHETSLTGFFERSHTQLQALSENCSRHFYGFKGVASKGSFDCFRSI
ncbi:GNAT family N-acetyltransferase [Stenomitos frigidus]|uniref:GNAT family N-acetyltransferase n=1 Tax=Stenomitos frigidus TaxID=1886765 RepID=UPI003BB4B445